MEKFFESKFMIKLQEFGQKLGQNKFLTSLQAAMMSLMGLIMIGAISQIVCAVGSESLLNLFKTNDAVYKLLYLPYNFTMDLLSVWVVLLLGYQYSKKLKLKSPVISGINSLVAFLIIGSAIVTSETGVAALDMSYFGAPGMFVGFFVAFLSVHIEKFCIEKNIRIKMPDAVPSFLQDSFTSLLPLLFNCIIFLVLNAAVSIMTNGTYTICSGFMTILGIPLGALTSVAGMFILCTFAAVLWCFGIHGTLVILPILIPLNMQAAATNAALYQAGEALQFFPVLLFNAMGVCGGVGNTLPLALLGLRSKSKQISAVAKMSAIPGWFGINEPLVFGMPIMMNPILCIPYILSVPVLMALYYVGYKIGFLSPAWIMVGGVLPMGFVQYLSTLRWQNAVWDYIMLIPATIIWYPFFKVYEKQLIARESLAELQELAEA